jgi:hypothetical protein
LPFGSRVGSGAIEDTKGDIGSKGAVEVFACSDGLTGWEAGLVGRSWVSAGPASAGISAEVVDCLKDARMEIDYRKPKVSFERTDQG